MRIVAKTTDGHFLLEIDPGFSKIVFVQGKTVIIHTDLEPTAVLEKTRTWEIMSKYEAVYITAKVVRELQRLEKSTKFANLAKYK
jgi:hypothetical protein